jgi:8-oxo-dGTP pyrophosphatase MutT (NUDIX family)
MMKSIEDQIKIALQNDLPGESAHIRMLPPGRRLNPKPEDRSKIKQSGVLVLLYPEDNRIFTCLIKRPATMKYHPGQISFPGGQIEKDDISLEMTALREANEEIGIQSNEIEILGRLSEFYIEVSNFTVQPILAWCAKKPDVCINKNEVERLIPFPLTDFTMNEIVMETKIETNIGLLNIYYYPFDDEIIWGATAMILAELIVLLKNI